MAQTTDFYTQALSRRTAVIAAIAPDTDLSQGSDILDELQGDAAGSAVVMYSIQQAQLQAYASTATGANLDALGADAGVLRIQATIAAITVTVSGAASGAPQGGWVVPQNTHFFTTADASGASIYFVSTSQTIVQQSANAAIACTCTQGGSLGNVVANAIAHMDATPGISLVSSTAPTTPAVDREADSAYRGRIAASRTVLGSDAFVEAAARAVAGCAFAHLSDPRNGTGASVLYAAAADGTLSSGLQSAVAAAGQAALPVGETLTAAQFGLVHPVVQVSIDLAAGFSSQQAAIIAAVQAQIAAFILTLGAGVTLQPGPMWSFVLQTVVGLADWYTTSAIPVVGVTSLCRLLAAPAVPVCGTASTGGALSNGTYFVQITWATASSETLASVETTVVLSGGTSTQTITVPIAAFPDASVTKANVYISATSGAEKLQGNFSTSTGGTYTQTAALSTGTASPPTTNTITIATVSVVTV